MYISFSGILADPFFHILWWKYLICMWKDIFSYKTIIKSDWCTLDSRESPFVASQHHESRVFKALPAVRVRSVCFGLLEIKGWGRGWGSGGVLHSPIRRIPVTRVGVESLTGRRQKVEERCQLGSHQPRHSVCHSGSSLHDAWTSACDSRNIPDCQTFNYITPHQVVCSTSHCWKKETACSHQRSPQSAQTQPGGKREDSRAAEMSSIRFPLVAWRTNIKQWGRRMFSFHKFEIKKQTCPWRGLAGGMSRGLQL